MSGKFDQCFPVTTDEQPPADFRKTCHPQTTSVNNKAIFDQGIRYCSRLICSLALFTVFIARLATPVMTTFYPQAKTKAQCGVIS